MPNVTSAPIDLLMGIVPLGLNSMIHTGEFTGCPPD